MNKYNLKNNNMSFWIDTNDNLRSQDGTIDVFDKRVLLRGILICIKQNQPLKYNLDQNHIWTYPVKYKKHKVYSIIGDV